MRAVDGHDGWFEDSKPCVKCALPIYWRFTDGDRERVEPRQDECRFCAPDVWRVKR